MSRKYSHILSPLKIGNVILKSRFLSANALPHFLQGPELYPSDAVVDYLVNIARNGAAIVTIGDWTNLNQRQGFGDGCHFPMWDNRDPALENALTLMVDQIHFYGAKVSAATHLQAPAGYGVYDGEPAGGMPILSPAEMEEMMEEMQEMAGGDGAPIYLENLISLAWVMNDDALKEKAVGIVEALLSSQREDGWFGPEGDPSHEIRVRALLAVRRYFLATVDKRALAMMDRFFKYLYRTLAECPLEGKSVACAADAMDLCLWLYNITGQKYLLELCRRLREQTLDWVNYFHTFPTISPMNRSLRIQRMLDGIREEEADGDALRGVQRPYFHTQFELTNGVTLATGLKTPGVINQFKSGFKEQSGFRTGWDKLTRFHGVACGMYTCDKHLNGADPAQGIDACAVARLMNTLETLIAFSDADQDVADLLEKLAYNALPAIFDAESGKPALLFEEYGLTRREAEELVEPIESVGAAQKRLSELKGQIKALGNVNVAAIEEYKEVSERYEFLSGQVDDVEKSKRELEKMIEELTQQMSELFLDRFNAINGYFRQTFTDLFSGGAAELFLEDEKDVLECGIGIRAQPPGKNVKNITLLSGGEKGLTAVALLFAILKVRPAPFCIFDEVEAALDDVNVVRYAQYVRMMTGNTQFILITHRRGTMEEADILYGVTMAEKGVSKLLELNTAQLVEQMQLEE